MYYNYNNYIPIEVRSWLIKIICVGVSILVNTDGAYNFMGPCGGSSWKEASFGLFSRWSGCCYSALWAQ